MGPIAIAPTAEDTLGVVPYLKYRNADANAKTAMNIAKRSVKGTFILNP